MRLQRLTICLPWLLLAALPAPRAVAARPKLVVVISVDQLPYQYIRRIRERDAARGYFRRVFEKGASYEECHHQQAFTITAPGHSVMLTGTYPSATGIIGNQWFDRHTGKTTYCMADPGVVVVGQRGEDHRVSPKNLLVPTVGDVLKLETHGQAKVFGVAVKDRASILMAGHAADAAYWFDDDTGNWVTSSYYLQELPGYLRNFNESVSAGSWGGKTWDLVETAEKYTPFAPDDNPYEVNVGDLGRTFPHTLPASDHRRYFQVLTTTPFGNDLTLAVARLIVTFEALGKDDAPDLLTINLSSNDYVGHAFGPHSLEAQDMIYRTDRQLGEFAEFVDQQLGSEPWVMALTSDHGVAPNPQYAAAQRLAVVPLPEGGVKELKPRLEAELRRQLGPPDEGKDYVQNVDDTSVYLQRGLTALAGDRELTAERIVRDELLEVPAIAAAYTREQLMQPAATDKLARQFQLAFCPRRSGDVLFTPPPYHGNNGNPGAGHGTPWRYDTHVPLMLVGSGIHPGRFPRPTSPAALAPTLAELLDIEVPPASIEEPLSEALGRSFSAECPPSFVH